MPDGDIKPWTLSDSVPVVVLDHHGNDVIPKWYLRDTTQTKNIFVSREKPSDWKLAAPASDELYRAKLRFSFDIAQWRGLTGITEDVLVYWCRCIQFIEYRYEQFKEHMLILAMALELLLLAVLLY